MSDSTLDKLIKRVKKDPELFHQLIFKPEKAFKALDFLDRRQRGRILAILPEDIIGGLAGLVPELPGDLLKCTISCGDSCTGTCVDSCNGTCGSSCDDTCATSCDGTVGLVSDIGQVINPGLEFGRLRRFTRFRR